MGEAKESLANLLKMRDTLQKDIKELGGQVLNATETIDRIVGIAHFIGLVY